MHFPTIPTMAEGIESLGNALPVQITVVSPLPSCDNWCLMPAYWAASIALGPSLSKGEGSPVD